MTGTAIQRYLEVHNFRSIFGNSENLKNFQKYQRFINMKIIISFMVGLSLSGTVPKMADGPPGMIVAPSGAVYKPEECGMDGNGDGWCAGESVPAEYFIDKEKIKKAKNKKVSLFE